MGKVILPSIIRIKAAQQPCFVDDRQKSMGISLEGVHKPHILNVKMDFAPEKVTLDGVALNDSADYHFDEGRDKLIIRTDQYVNGKYLIYK